MLNVGGFHITTIFYKKAWEEIPINELARNSLLVKWLACFNNLWKYIGAIIYFQRSLLPSYIITFLDALAMPGWHGSKCLFTSSSSSVPDLMTQDRIQNQISRQGCKIVNSWYTEEWLTVVTLTHVGKLLGSSSSIITLASWGGRRQKGKGVTCSHWWWQVQQRNSLHPSKHWHQKLSWKCSLWYAVFFLWSSDEMAPNKNWVF